MIEKIDSRNLGIKPELLRKVTEDSPDLILVFQNIQIPKLRGAGIGFLKSCNNTHEGGLPCPVWTEQSEHSGSNRKGHILQCLYAIRIRLAKVLDYKFHLEVPIVYVTPSGCVAL